MSDFFTAYRERMQRNHDTFMAIAKELSGRGLNVYHPEDGLVGWLYIESANHHIYFGFSDVPYRWYLDYNIDAREKQGSGRRLKEVAVSENPFLVDEIINSMKPIPEKRVPGPKPTQYLVKYDPTYVSKLIRPLAGAIAV